MPVCEPVIVLVTVSVAVRDWLPAVLSVAVKVRWPDELEGMYRLIGGRERIVGWYRGLGVGARGMGGASVIRRRVTENVFGAYGDAVRSPGRWRRHRCSNRELVSSQRRDLRIGP